MGAGSNTAAHRGGGAHPELAYQDIRGHHVGQQYRPTALLGTYFYSPLASRLRVPGEGPSGPLARGAEESARDRADGETANPLGGRVAQRQAPHAAAPLPRLRCLQPPFSRYSRSL